MRNINVYIPPETFMYIMRNSTSRDVVKGHPKYTLYYRKRDHSLGHVVIELDVLWTAARNCKFDSFSLKKEFFDDFFPSLKTGLVDSKVNYLWRTYSWNIE